MQGYIFKGQFQTLYHKDEVDTICCLNDIVELEYDLFFITEWYIQQHGKQQIHADTYNKSNDPNIGKTMPYKNMIINKIYAPNIHE